MIEVDAITSADTVLAYVIRGEISPAQTTFVTDDDAPFQVGFVVKEAGVDVQRHEHRPVERNLTSTSEALIVREGRCEVDVYSDSRELVATRTVGPGDTVVFLAGGHGIRITERTVFLEVKQGPYPGQDEKQGF